MATRRPHPALYALLVASAGGAAAFGFVREAAIGALYGASRQSDAYYAAFILPFVAAFFLVGGALAPPLTAAVAARFGSGDEAGGRALFVRALRTLLLGGGAAALLVGAGRGPIAALLVPGFDAPGRALTASLLTTLTVYGLATSLVQLASAGLVAAGSYRAPALATLLGNATSVAFLLGLGRGRGIEAAAWAMNAGAVVALAALVPRLLHHRLLSRPTVAAPSLPWRDTALLVASLAIAASVDLLERPFASTAAVGTIALLSFASKLVHLPMRLVAAPLASVAFPRLVKSRVVGAPSEAGQTAGIVVQLLVYCASVTAAAAGPIAALTFGRGRFDAAAVGALGRCLGLLAPAVVAIGFGEVAMRFLVASGRTAAVARAQAAGLAVYVGAAFLLRPFGATGLAAARSVSWSLASVALAIALRRHVRLAVEPGRTLLAALLGGAAAALAAHSLPGGSLVRVAAAGLLAAAPFAALLFTPASLARAAATEEPTAAPGGKPLPSPGAPAPAPRLP